jgi:cobalt-zinc-cadmium efflux system membrane fusion protein
MPSRSTAYSERNDVSLDMDKGLRTKMSISRDEPTEGHTAASPPASANAPLRGRRVLVSLAAGGLLLAITVALLAKRSGSTKAASQAEVADVVLDGSRIRFSDSFADRHHIESAPVIESELSPTVLAMGTVRYDVRKFAAIGARSAGRIRHVFKIMGDKIRPGDVLADIESVDLGRAQAKAAALHAREMAAWSNLQRESQLAAAKVTAAREAEIAKADYQVLRAEQRAAEKEVMALGATPSSEVGIIKLRSPIAGRVIMVRASRGQTVEPSDTLFKVADLSSVWVELMVFERDLHRVHTGDPVDILPAGVKSDVVHGTVAHVGDIVDPATRSAIARVEVDNKQGWLHPGESASARISTRSPVEKALTIPKAAVTFVDGKPTALVRIAPGLVEPRALALGSEDGQRVAVNRGLVAGDQVITRGLFALKAEIFR